MMYSDVVMEKAEDIEPAEGKGVRVQLEHLMATAKKTKAKNLGKPRQGSLRHRPFGHRSETAVRELQEEGRGGAGPRVSRRSQRATLGRHRRGVQELAGPPGGLLPQDRGHSRRVGHRLQRPEHGLRQPGQHLGHRRGLLPQPGHRREQVLRRVARQRPGRGRGGRHPHAQSA